MNSENFKTPLNKPRFDTSRGTASKRDSLAAELERDPQFSTAKRQQRTQVFNSTISHANLERQLLAAQTANSELETKLREKELQIERLERDRRYLADREKEEREEKEREREAYDEAKRKSDSELRSLRTSLTTLREEHADLLDTHSSLTRSTTQTANSQKALITTLQHRVQLLEDEHSQARQIADERSRILANLQAEYDELSEQNDRLLQSVSEQENMGIVREELQKQASYLRNLESTNAKLSAELNVLRERHQSIEVLREEKRGLETKLVVMSEMREKVVRLEAELGAARGERQQWASKSSDTSMTQTLSELRLAHAKVLEEYGATAATLRQREAEVANLEQREVENQETIQDLEGQVRALTEERKRVESRTMLAEREVGYLEALLSSYKAEEAYENDASRPTVDETKLQHVQSLEALVGEYKSVNERLMQELETLENEFSLVSAASKSQVPGDAMEKVEKEKLVLQTTLAEQEKEIQAQLETIDKLEQTLFELSGEIAGGRHVPPNTRVLCMKENPDQEWVDLRQATMDRLKAENEALIKRLKELEDSGASTGAASHGEELVPRASWEQVNREREELQKQVTAREKRLTRLQEIFKAKSEEFREAISAIIGLKFAFFPNGQVRVTSLFDLGTSFIFQPLKGGGGMKMQLTEQTDRDESEGLQDLPNMIGYWIENEQCPPGFLASVTLECYEKWKENKELGAWNQ
ncbi:hypothetical protein D9611_009640 [Ephemerocybe angulata]|uniref:Spindle assembly checkpoint component MAD1 n=1 Tax=Ephemerocybe angulata TaxID=980116 RepID=A0A8H5FGB3_9AGAR|nr:hypothetical protein D9611_009640 [Tulosesus angulatus]